MTEDIHSGWMLYGATGATGRRILEIALSRGHRPILAGRNGHKLRALAETTGLESVELPLEGSAQGSRALDGVKVLLNAAGPYALTGTPLRRLCLAAGVSYLDVNGEIDDFRKALGLDAQAKEHKIAIVPGAGFSTVYGTALAMYLAAQMPDARWIRLSYDLANAETSPAAAASTAEVLATGGFAMERGLLLGKPLAHRSWRVVWPDAPEVKHSYYALPRADLLAVHRATGIGNVLTGSELPAPLAFLLRFAGPLVAKGQKRRAGKPNATGTAEEAQSQNGSLRSRILAEAGIDKGVAVSAVLETGEGYEAAANAAIATLERMLATPIVGAMTPAEAFGPTLVQSLPNTHISNLVFAARSPVLREAVL